LEKLAIFNQEETMISTVGRNMWRMFSSTSKMSGNALYKATRDSVIETGRASAAAGLVFGGFYVYNRVTETPPANQPVLFKPSLPTKTDETPQFDFSPK